MILSLLIFPIFKFHSFMIILFISSKFKFFKIQIKLNLIDFIIPDQVRQLMKPAKKQKVTLTELQRYLPFPAPDGNFSLPSDIKKFLLAPSFNNFSLKEQNSIQQKYLTCYRNYFQLDLVIDHLDKITNGKYYRHSLQTALRNTSEKYGLIDWYKFYQTVKSSTNSKKHQTFKLTNDLLRLQTHSIQIQKRASEAVQRVFRLFKQRKRVKKGREQVQQIKKTLQQRLINEFGKESIKQVKEFYQKNSKRLEVPLKQFESSLPPNQKVSFVTLERLLNSKFEMYIENKKVIYLYLHFDPQNRGSFEFSKFKETILQIKKQVQFVSQKSYLSSVNQVQESIRKDMKAVFYSAFDMINDFTLRYLCTPDEEPPTVHKDDQIPFQPFYKFISDKGQDKYSQYQIRKILSRIQYFDNFQFLFNQPKYDELIRSILKISQKKKKKKQLHSQNQVFYSYKKILLLIISKSKAQKLTKQSFAQFVSSHDPTLKYNSFFCVFRVYGNLINIKRIKQQSQLNSFACLMKTLKTQNEYEQIFDQFHQAYPPDLELPYSIILDKINLRLDFCIENNSLKPLNIELKKIVNYRDTIKELFQPDFDLVARSYIHRKVASKFVSLYKRIQSNKHRFKSNAMNLLSQAFNQQTKKASKKKDTIESNDSKSRFGNKKITTQKSIAASCKTKKSQVSQKKYKPQDLQMMKELIFDILDKANQEKNDSIRQKLNSKVDYKTDFVTKHKIVSIKKDKISFRSSISNSLAYDELIGLLIFGNNSELMCYRNQQLEKIDIKLLYRPNLIVLGVEIFSHCIVLITSYLTLEFYKLHQPTKYPFKTIKIGDSRVQQVTNHDIQRFTKNGQFGAYPKLIKTLSSSILAANLSFVDCSLCVLRKKWQQEQEKEDEIISIKLSKRQHYFSQQVQEMITSLNKKLQKKPIEQRIKLANQIVDFFSLIKQQMFAQTQQIFDNPFQNNPNPNDPNLQLSPNQNITSQNLNQQTQQNETIKQQIPREAPQLKPIQSPPSLKLSPIDFLSAIKASAIKQTQKKDLLSISLNNYKKFLQILQTKQENDEGRKIISEYQFLEILKFFLYKTEKQIFRAELRLQLVDDIKDLLRIKVPEEIREVTNTVQEYLVSINYSLKNLIQILDQQKEGCIKVKKIKDYFLKITQQTFLIHQKKIDSYLRKLAIGKHVSYHSFVSIFTQWNFKIWEKPRLIVRDFLLLQKFDLLIYTLDDDNRIFIRTLSDESRIVAILDEHKAVPCIALAQDQLILISGDSAKNGTSSVNICLWRLHEDVILKIWSKRILRVKPIHTKTNVHQDGITSLIYLPLAHCLVTASLDSTLKFHLILSNPFKFEQVQRIYFQDCYYLGLSVKNFQINKDMKSECLVSLRIKKHINDKNANKYEVTCELYDVQKIAIKTTQSNKFLDLPMKIVSLMENHAYNCSQKKHKLICKKLQYQMEAFIATDYLQMSLDSNFYSALKNYFIFKKPNRLINLLHYIQKKGNSAMILDNILLKYGLKIIDKNLFSIESSNQQILLLEQNPNLFQSAVNLSQIQRQILEGNLKIDIFQEQYQSLQKALQNASLKQSGLINVQKLKKIVEIFIFGREFQKFNLILDYQKNKFVKNLQTKQIQKQRNKSVISGLNNQSNNHLTHKMDETSALAPQILLNVKVILQYFRIRQTRNNIDRLYQYLRELALLLKKSKTPIWRIFSTFQQNITKQRYVLAKNFTYELKKIGFSQHKIQLILWYLADNQKLSIFQLLNYIEIAVKQDYFSAQISQAPQLSQILKSSIFQQETKKLLSIENFNQSQLKESLNKKKPKQNTWINHKMKKIENQKALSSRNQKRSESGSVVSSRKQSRKLSHKGRQTPQRSESGSRKLTPSNSMGNFTREVSYSNTKDSKKRQVYQIRHKLHNLLGNQKKTLWELVSSAIPQFLQEPIITENEYFDLFKLLKSTLKLSEKLALLSYLKQQHPQRVIDLNDLFQLLDDSNKTYVHGQKYIVPYFVNRLTSSDENLTIEQALELYFFQSQEQITLEQLIQKCCCPPFKFNHFALKQFEQLLIRQSKSGFVKEDIIDLVDKVSQKYDLKIENRNLTILEEILFKMDKRKVPFEQIFPKLQNVTEFYFIACINKLSQKYEKKIIAKDFEMIKLCYKKTLRKKADNPISASNTKRTSKSTASRIIEIPYAKFKAEMIGLLEETRESTDKERESGRKLWRYLQSKRISMFNFFISLDLQKKFFLNEVQFETGLTEIGISHSFWKAIPKKLQNRLYYYELIRYLVDSNILDIKCVDSELELSMEKLIKRVIKNGDVEKLYQKMIDQDDKSAVRAVTFKSFSKFFSQNYTFFTPKQLFYLFSTFCNAEQIKNSKFSNDQVIKNQENIEKTFNFKMFVEVISIYRTQTITKTPQYKFIDYLKKRNISLLHQFYKFMEKNKKNKEISQALKKKSSTLSRELVLAFMNQIKAGLNEKQFKEILSLWPQSQIDFSLVNQRLQNIYKKASSCIEKQQAEIYLGQIYKKITSENVSISRMFSDFCQQKNNKLFLKDFMNMSDFLNTGLNKIQLKKVFTTLLDEENKGYCFLSELMEAIDNVQEKIDKDDQDYQFQFIIEKIQNNLPNIQIRESLITFPLQKCITVFEKVLTKSEATQLYTKVVDQQKKLKQLTEKDFQVFIQTKINERKMKTDKKYKQLVMNLLNTIKKSNVDISEVFKYFTIGSKSTQILTKDRFLLLYQSVIPKSNIVDINNLYTYFDENKTNQISLMKWEQKLGIIDLENQNVEGSIDDLKVFYKVKIFLAELYLVFIQKQFKLEQIYHYFDKHSSGFLKYNEFWTMIYDLGFQPGDELERKVVNYLDRTKARIIDIKILMNELDNCLGKKQKLVLETKTSFIFKKNASIIQSKYNYFVNELIKKEELVEKVYQDNEVHQQSCIMESDFLNILKKFGIYLIEQQLNDLRRNFQAKQDYLYLYPIYFMLKNIFQENSSFQEREKSEKELFKTLLKQMIKNKITLKELEKIKSHQEMKTFLKQLKTFTPIEVQIIIQSISFDQTSIISIDKLKFKIRDSYVETPSINDINFFTKTNLAESMNPDQTLNLIHEDDYLNETLRDHLRSLLKFQTHIDLLQMYPKNIYIDDFKQILQKLGCKIKVKDMKKYFKAFSTNKKYIKTQNLIFEDNFSAKKLEQDFQMEDTSELSLLIEHIQKSLKYTNRKLRRALQKYFIDNYGFITVDNFIRFLRQIGYQEGETENKNIDLLIQFYQKNYQLNQMDKKCLELQIGKLEDILSTQEQENEQLQPNSDKILQIKSTIAINKKKNYLILSSQIKEIIIDLKAGHLKFIQYLKQLGIIESFTIQDLYRFIVEELCPQTLTFRQKSSYLKAAKTFCSQFKTASLSLQAVEQKVNFLIKFHYINSHTENKQPSGQKREPESLTEKVCKSNIIQIFIEQVSRLVQNVSKTQIGSQNIDRVTLNILFEQILETDHLLFVGSNLQKAYQRQKSQKLQINQKFDDVFVSLNTGFELVIQSERSLEQKAVTIINEKYYGIPTNRREEFDSFAKLASHLNPNSKFIRAKGYYMWTPNTKIMPKCAIRYRWKYINNFAFKLLNQFAKIHQLGYCCPHLRFEDLNQDINVVIDKVLYPWRIDSAGKIAQIIHPQIFELQQAYTVPEIIRDDKGKITSKCDTWIFGCLLYQFIWGHQPNAYFSELFKFLRSRNISDDLDELLEMSQFPAEFKFQFFNEQKIIQLYEDEFYFGKFQPHRNLKFNIKKWQTFKGLTHPLELIFDKQLVYYQQEIEMLAELHQIICEALDPNPSTRPSIEELMHRQIFKKVQNFHIQPYIDTLDRHIENSIFGSDIFQAIDKIQTSILSQPLPLAQVDCYINKLIQFLTEVQNMQSKISKVDKIFTIPRNFAWPQGQIHEISRDEKPYSYNMACSKDSLLQNPLFSTVCRIFTKQIIPKTIHTFICASRHEWSKGESFQSERNLLKTQNQLQMLLLTVMQMSKTYNSPVSGFVEDIIDSMLYYVYENPQLKINLKNQNLNSSFLAPYSRIKKDCAVQENLSDYFKIPSINNQKTQFVKKIQTIIYLNGQGNSQYTPISDFLTENQTARLIIEFFYSSLDLMTLTTKCQLAVNYFRDRFYLEQEIPEVLKILKIQLLVLKNLHQKTLKETCLSYLNELIENCRQLPLLFSSHLFYINLSMLLRNPLQTPQVKKIVLDIIQKLLVSEDQTILETMKSSSCNVFPFIIRLLIQPGQNSALRDQYESLRIKLGELVEIVESSLILRQVFESIEGGLYALKHFKGEQYLGESFRSIH